MRPSFHHTEGFVMILFFLLVCFWVVSSPYFTNWFRLFPLPCVITSIVGLALMRFVAAGPNAKYLPENARSCSDFQKRKLAERPWHGQVCVITGTTSGIGLETVKEVALLGAHVVMVDMHENKDENSIPAKTIKMIKKADPQASLMYVKANLQELGNIAAAALEIVKAASALRGTAVPAKLSQQPQQQCIEFLVNNAGRANPVRQFTPEGFEAVFTTNYLGPYLLTEHLLPYVTNNGRVVNVASVAHTWFDNLPFTSLCPRTRMLRILNDIQDGDLVAGVYKPVYPVSKFCNLTHAITLSKRLEEKKKSSNVTVCSVYPGAVFSGIWNFIPYPYKYVSDALMLLFFKNNVSGSQTTLHCLTAGNIIKGQYYADCQPFRPRNLALDSGNQEAVEDWTREKLAKWLPK